MQIVRYTAIFAALLIAISPATRAQAASPLADAVAVWHMTDAEVNAGHRAGLTVHGKVRLGVALDGAERDASRRRGGDGSVAEFRGGYLTAGKDATNALQLAGDKMTFCIRLRNPKGKWGTPLFARNAPDDKYSNILHVAPLNTHVIGYPHVQRIKEGAAIQYLWRTTPLKDRTRPDYFTQGESPNLLRWHTDWEAKHTPARKGDFLNGVLRLNAPTELIGPDRWYDIVVRFNRAKLQMFVDGVLIDEDWPHGNLHKFMGPFLFGAGYQEGKLKTGFHGQIDHVALWDRALSDDEIMKLSGGCKEATRRDAEILGARKPVGQYWRPHGFNTSVGDCMTFVHDDTFHIFYLSDRRHGGSKWGLIATPWGHVSTKDFVHWEEHPCPLDITEPWECCLGTGSIVHHDGRFYIFYIKHDRRAWFKDNPNFGEAIFVAASDDCINFKKEPSPLMVPGFFGENDINSDVYPDRTNGGFILSLANWKVFTSKDLKHWTPRANLATPKWWPCTSYFEWDKQKYFTSCGQHWTSQKPIEDPSMKWVGPPHQTLNDGIKVSQVSRFKDRHIMVGFTPSPPNAYYGGSLLVRELIRHPDGTLGTKWLKEMIPKSGAPKNLSFKAVAGDATAKDGTLRVSAPDGFAVGALDGVPHNVKITLRVTPQKGTKQFGLCVRGEGDYKSGCELQFAPDRGHVQFAGAREGRMAEVPGNWMAIPGVAGIDKPFTLELIVKEDFIDVCIDNRRTIITRNRAKHTGDRLFFVVDHGEVTFENIQVRPLLAE